MRPESKQELKSSQGLVDQQQPPAVASKVPISAPPKKEKGLLARLGFNKNKSASQQRQPPLVTQQQRNGLSSVR